MTADATASPAERDELVRLRRDFHRHPELGYQEKRTSSIVARHVEALGYDVRTGVAKTGVIASRGGSAGPALLIRADMDALPIQEQNDVEYRSENDGVMHACGHDAHTAIGMVVASRFSRADLTGSVRFAFQPAEEGGMGADRMMEEGLLDGIDGAFGLHLWNELPFGKVAASAGPMMAAVDDVTIEIRGRGGHAAIPHLTDDPIVRAAGMIRDLQTIVSRRVDPFEAAVVSITQISAGNAFNVIPDRVQLRGTVRTFRPEVRDEVHLRLREIVGEHGDVQIDAVTRALVNDEAMSALVRRVAADVVGEENVVDARTMGGEDFASVLAAVPGCFFFVGSASPDGAHPHHSPHFDVDERALPLGLEVMTRAARAFLEQGRA